MFLGISFVGWLILLFIYLPILLLLGWLLRKAFKGAGARKAIWIGTAGLMVLPVADGLWLDWRFQSLCEDSGLHVTRKVEVEGFYDDTHNWGYSFDKSGFRFVESRVNRNEIERAEWVDGKVKRWPIDKPTARYHYKYTRRDELIGWRFKVTEGAVVDTHTNEVVGRDTTYYATYAAIDKTWIGLLGQTPRMCPSSMPTARSETLIPIGKR